MPKVNVNKQHDYITLRVVWSKELRINMTWSYSGQKVSFVGLPESQVRVILKLMKTPFDTYQTNGPWIDAIAKMAETAADGAALIAGIEALRAAKPDAKPDAKARTVARMVSEIPGARR